MKDIRLLWSRTGRTPKGRVETPASDAQFIERLKLRDERAFMDLYDLHRGAVYRFLMHMTGSITMAEELTQDVFVTVLDFMCAGTLGRFDPGKGTLEGYLLGIARNLARAERRRIHRFLPLDNVIETPEWERLLNTLSKENRTWDVAALMAARSELRVLYRAILDLPEHYREAVVLCSLQERSYRDAAAILQCSEGTVASRMNRAKALLAAKFRRSTPENVNAARIGRGKEGVDGGTAINTNEN